MFCNVCGVVDDYYDEDALVDHNNTPKHICNKILEAYREKKRNFAKNRDGVIILGRGESAAIFGAEKTKVENTDHQKIRMNAKPTQPVKFSFTISNDMKNEDLLIVGIQLAHPQPQFLISDHPYIFGGEPNILEKKTTKKNIVFVTFAASEIGTYEMPIMFTFHRRSDEKNIIIIREMVVSVFEEESVHMFTRSPYTNEDWETADQIIPSIGLSPYPVKFKVPRLLKILLPHGLEEKALENIRAPREIMEQLRLVLISTRAIFDEGLTKSNYMAFFHHLLWWEEVKARINLRKYNMFSVMMEQRNGAYILEVPGLAEKRPSLLRGDRVYIKPQDTPKLNFECTIKDIELNRIVLTDLDETFEPHYKADALFDVRFLMSRVPAERMHEAVNSIHLSKQLCRVFPDRPKRQVSPALITRFYNKWIENNKEQRSAVEHIVAGTSGRAPYIVFGPPGTGKTMTIVEAIIQLVVRNSRNRIMVCTDSNMAADHIALMLLRYNKQLNISNFLLRGCSQSREWSVMPQELAQVSNGVSYETFYTLSNAHVSQYRVFVTTLLHAAKYGMEKCQAIFKLQMTHLFIDEAAQASEPATLVPVTGLLAPTGHLVLAGDPQQLGPVCISREAKDRGLGVSLLQRLRTTFENFYSDDPNFITMLVKNFRSHPDILAIPNELFYENNLQALAQFDPISEKSILNLPGGNRAVIFHAVNSKEQRMGKAPSFYNEKELDMLKKYVRALVDVHNVLHKDIGVIAPYIRQVYKMKEWLTASNYSEIEVGTVESFQGKEKRVILVSTVRANCRLLDYDAKYGLGFLVDDKRYNVTLTRAKAKLIIIGNPACLTRDVKWRKYMGFCNELNCYHGKENQQLERSSQMLVEIARTRFDRARISDELKQKNQSTH
ncbi:putative helicase mov-10-B.1 [Papilio machaon]|uniref:putative helicase mov-10-B.1 n=1 Tax=Papilio machaon TaxID=76193 RepID=UPI001E6644AC|nr:putative helicase mov-10-B.1 [Papilio machaon]